jgi:hypothetical protein
MFLWIQHFDRRCVCNLSGNQEISVWRTVWVTTNCCSMSGVSERCSVLSWLLWTSSGKFPGSTLNQVTLPPCFRSSLTAFDSDCCFPATPQLSDRTSDKKTLVYTSCFFLRQSHNMYNKQNWLCCLLMLLTSTDQRLGSQVRISLRHGFVFALYCLTLHCNEPSNDHYKIQGGSNMTGTNCDLFTHK